MTEEEKQILRKTQATLQNIDSGAKVFFNIVWYEKMGLTFSRKVWGVESGGSRAVIRHTHHLTLKAKRMIQALI